MEVRQMNIAICDDLISDIHILKKLLFSNNYIKNNGRISEFTSSSELYANLKSHTYDVVFLDIDMPEINGIELGQKIHNEYPNTFIIFVTNYSQYALDAFDCYAFHYLLKPLDKRRSNKVIDALVQKFKEKNKYHIIRIKNHTIRIPISDIYFVEYCRRHVIYHLKDKDYETVGRFSDVYEDLKDYGFYQIHQGYIVNMDKIIDFDKYSAILQDGKSVMISVRKRTEVLSAYTNYILKDGKNNG